MIGVGGVCSTIFALLVALSTISVAFVIFSNILASSLSAAICSSSMFGKGVAGAGYF